MDKTTLGHVDYTVENGVGTIEFFHPSHNSLPGQLLAKLANTITTAGEDAKSRVLILKSGGDRTFCAGASFDELASIDTIEKGRVFFSGFANVINACRKCPKLIIGRVQGKAVGGGVGVASAVDYCVATKYAATKLSELALGIGPFVVGPAVARKIGESAMSQMAIDATTWKSAEWSRDKGLYTEVFESVEVMDEYIQAFAAKLATMHIDAMTELKKIFWQGTENWDDLLTERAEISGTLVLSEFTKSAIAKIKGQ